MGGLVIRGRQRSRKTAQERERQMHSFDHMPHDRGPKEPVMLDRYEILTICDALALLADRMSPEAHMEDRVVMTLSARFDALAAAAIDALGGTGAGS